MNQSKIRYKWNQIPWHKLEVSVFKLQKRIYQASIRNDVKLVHRLQKLLLNSTNAKLLAIRRVTQDNQGRKTAGIDGVANLTQAERLSLMDTIDLNKRSKPVRRVWIPKPGKLEKRPLGIPTMLERVKQALVKIVLEPEWEAKFEPNSYGFRPGRSCHDAREAIFLSLNPKSKFILDADITGCFDNINHNALLNKLNTTSLLRRVIKGWLKAGVMEGGVFYDTERGTPQGGVISPLLANIALHGLENDTKQALSKELFDYVKKKYGQANHTNAQRKLSIIRYADDFIVIHENEEIIHRAKSYIEQWLKNIGLEMKPSKTRIIHSLRNIDEQTPGFDFLGFTVRHYPVKQTSKGHKLLIKPSRESQKRHIQTLHKTLKSLSAKTQEAVITTLNPIINGWSRYYITSVSRKIFEKMDCDVHYNLWKWAKYRHPNKGAGWIKRKYFHKLGNYNWRFMTKSKEKEYVISYHSDNLIKRHAKVKGNISPYNGDWVYWASRLGRTPGISPRISKLLKNQYGKCHDCKLWFRSNDLLEVHHEDRNRNNNKLTNLKLLHRHCHDIVHNKRCA